MLSDDYYGDRFRWFVGVVKDVGDDLARVRVRIFGIHHTEDTTKVSDGDLPWAMVMYPTTGGQTSGGNAAHGLTPGTWVVGFFVDGEDSQQPIVIGVINGGQNSMNASPPQGSSADTNNPNLYSSNPSSGNPSSTTPDSSGSTDNNTGPTTAQLSGSSNDAKIFNYFWEKLSASGAVTGNLKAICAAVVGNVYGESGWNPQAYNGNDKGEKSVGICQWRGGKYDRLNPMLRFCGHSGEVTKGNLPPLEKQLDFMWHELQTSERKAFNKMVTGQTVSDALEGMIAFERPDFWKGGNIDKNASSWKARLNAANQAFSKLSYTGGSGGTS
jgi:hypothetical protein